MHTTLFKNGHFFVVGDQYARSVLVRGGKIDKIALDDSDDEEKIDGVNETIDLEGKLVLPAFVDAHCHLMPLGESIEKVDLYGCESLQDILDRLHAHNDAHPHAPRISARGWIPDMTTAEEIDRRHFDCFGDKPVYLESSDLHSCLVNSAALKEVSIEDDTPNPSGGAIVRDANNRVTGWVQEMAHLHLVNEALQEKTSQEDKQRYVDNAFSALLTNGYTAMADLLTGEEVFAMLEAMLEKDGCLPVRVRCFWLVSPDKDMDKPLAAVDRALELKKRWEGNEWLQMNGIKLVTDGVIDSCTASMLLPYQDGSNGEPIWPLDMLTPVIQTADSYGLQCAVHAIGDLAVHNAVEALSTVGRDNIVQRRHRMEHLEMSAEKDGNRLGELGITVSVQPVHSDPAILINWHKQLGDNENEGRCSRAFAYKHFLEAGAPLAIGTDAPTAPNFPLPNLHIATTRTSALQPDLLKQTTPQFALPLVTAVSAATNGAARACHLEALQGSLREGLSADFNVFDVDILEDDLHKSDRLLLLKAKITATYMQGRRVTPSPQRVA